MMRRCAVRRNPDRFDLPIASRMSRVEYAVRGPIVNRAELFVDAIANGKRTIIDPDTGAVVPFDFDKVIWCQVGNPMAMGQRPLAFPRAVLSRMLGPPQEERPPRGGDSPVADASSSSFDEAVRTRADTMLSEIGGWPMTGGYTMTKGFPAIRRKVARFISSRDGFDVNTDDIFLTNGASSGIELVLSVFAAGVLIPFPQYPLYSAVLTTLGAHFKGYQLDESAGWSVSAAQLDERITVSRDRGVDIRAIVVINPGNPTGQVLTRDAMGEIAELCRARRLLLLADEVYQENVYTRPFVSFHSVCASMGSASPPLVSFHSTSKGCYGECGFRGGYMHLHNVDAPFQRAVAKLASTRLCASVPGQLLVGLMIDEPSTDTDVGRRHAAEKRVLYDSLARRASTIVDGLNQFEGIRCKPVEGALYAFPSIDLPPRFIQHARDCNFDETAADALWAQRLLDATGLVVIPGSGFRQKAGTYHFRTTILPPEDEIGTVASTIGNFHRKLWADYA